MQKIVQMLQSITKIDIRQNDADGHTIFQSVTHSLPAGMDDSVQRITQIHEVLRGNQPYSYYHYIDAYGLEYVAAGIWNEGHFAGSIVLGPVLSSLSAADYDRILFRNQLPTGGRQALEQFYQSLPILSEHEIQHIGELLVFLCTHRPIPVHRITSELPKAEKNVRPEPPLAHDEICIIEERYQYQNELMDAIAKGNPQKAKVQIDHLMKDLAVFSQRVPESPIRSSKNIGFVLNTICRIAAEKGGVHPVYLHNISERFANGIERTKTIPHLKQLFLTMVHEYCELVKSVSTAGYSPVIQKAVDYILLHLSSPLSLQQIAQALHVHPAHLSRKFKEETGMTVTEFIQRKRIDEAKYYLERGHLSITDVAFKVGFNDLNYFDKVFKKMTSETPSQYVKRNRRSP